MIPPISTAWVSERATPIDWSCSHSDAGAVVVLLGDEGVSCRVMEVGGAAAVEDEVGSGAEPEGLQAFTNSIVASATVRPVARSP